MSEGLARVVEQFLELRWEINPVEATSAGRHERDGRFGAFEPTAVREYTAALRSYASSLEEAEADSLDAEIDRTAALHAARHDILVLERERPFARDPAFHLGQAMDGLFLLLARLEQDPARRTHDLLERLRALPDFLARAREVVTDPVAVLAETASAMLPGALALVRDALDEAPLDPAAADPAEVELARSGAVDALVAFGDWLAELSESEGASPKFAVGREIFDRKLHTAHMIQEGADELARYGERLAAEALAELERLARAITPGARWQDVAARLREDVPPPDRVLAEYDESVREATEFVRARGLVDVPSAAVRVAPTPDYLRVTTPFAAYLPPGAFDDDQTGTFFVTLPEPGSGQRPDGRAELPVTVVHEAMPGHHLQIVTANALPQPARRVLVTPAAQEGWALYGETLMAEQGFLATPERRFAQARDLYWRALRITLDVALHTRGLPITAAVAVLRDSLGMDAASALAEVRRYCAMPTYQLCYAVGRRDILRLRDDARRARRADFSLRDFHRELLGYGSLPTALARWGMGLV